MHRCATLVALAAFLFFTGCDQSTLTGTSEPEATQPQPASVDAAPSSSEAEPGDVIPGQYVVILNDEVDDVASVAQSLLSDVGGTLGFTYSHALTGFSAELSETAATALEALPLVARVEPDRVVQAFESQQGATWGLDRSDQRGTNYDDEYTYTATGDGVTAYVIDTGIRTSHNDFGTRATAGFDAFDDGQNGQDCNGHGTHVAGTVGGAAYGVAKDVDLVAVRVLDCGGSGSTSGVIAGVDWVTANAGGASVANMSLGGGISSALDDAVRSSIESGVPYSLAAGNGNALGFEEDACNSSPARVEEGITIGASDNTDAKASFSNYGPCVDFFAPGVDITSAWIEGDDDTNTISGTSMAAPHVAGAAALYLETNTGASPQAVRDALLDATTKNAVSDSRTERNHLLYTLVGDGSDDGSGDGDGDEGSGGGGGLLPGLLGR